MAWGFLSSFPVPPFCLFSGPGESIPTPNSRFNSKFPIRFSPVGKIFSSNWESDFLCASQSHDKGTQSYVTRQIHMLFSSPSFLTVRPASWASPRRAGGSRANGYSSSPDIRPFPAPSICHQIAHHATHFLPAPVGEREFRAIYMRSQNREKYWNDGLAHVFFEERYCEIPNYLCVL